jgi:hypothetical protein
MAVVGNTVVAPLVASLFQIFIDSCASSRSSLDALRKAGLAFNDGGLLGPLDMFYAL